MQKDDKQFKQEKGFGVIELDDEQLEGVMGGEDINIWKCGDTQNSGNCVSGCACSP